jgi:hypothetical protein
MSVWDDLVESCKDAVGRDVNDLNDVADVVDELNREVCRLNREIRYSEENVFQFFERYREDFLMYRNIQVLPSQFKQWFEQFKKK